MLNPTVPAKRSPPMPVASDINDDSRSPNPSESDGFERVLTRDERRKQRKLERHTPQFQFDTSYFRMGKKVGIAVSSASDLCLVIRSATDHFISAYT
jgi:hypothetical protein